MLKFSPLLSMYFYGCYFISFACFFRRIVGTEPKLFLYSSGCKIDRCYEFFSSVIKTNAFITRYVVCLNFFVTLVLRRSGSTQIIPFIIGFVSIFVVNFVFRPFAFYVEPCEAVSHIFVAVYSYFYSTFVLKSSALSNNSAFRQGNFPCKYASFFIVTKNRAHIFRRQISQSIFVPANHYNTLIHYVGIVKCP